MDETAELVDRRRGPSGEIALRRRGDRFEVIANGCFLMDSSDGRSERLMVTAALDALDRPDGARVLIGGLGVGFSLAAASADPRPDRISVVEREQAVIDWHTRDPAPLRRLAGPGHSDPRARVIRDDLLRHLAATLDRYDAVCLDIDNGPDWTVTDGNRGLYGPAGLDLVERVLNDRGVLSVWSAMRSPGFTRLLESRFDWVKTLEVPVLPGRRGEPDVVFLAGATVCRQSARGPLTDGPPRT